SFHPNKKSQYVLWFFLWKCFFQFALFLKQQVAILFPLHYFQKGFQVAIFLQQEIVLSHLATNIIPLREKRRVLSKQNPNLVCFFQRECVKYWNAVHQFFQRMKRRSRCNNL